jgi:putative hydrolase of HD superfamily
MNELRSPVSEPRMKTDESAPRLNQQLEFLMQIDALKAIERRTRIANGLRQENTAEHSWHLAMFALVLAEYAEIPVNAGHVAKLLLVHDIVEVDAGDTFLYDTIASAGQAVREQAAADRLYGLLPEDQNAELRALWDEFEARTTPEAIFAKAIDRMQPILLNLKTEGYSWQAHSVQRSQVVAHNEHLRVGAPRLWQHISAELDRAVDLGWLGSN